MNLRAARLWYFLFLAAVAHGAEPYLVGRGVDLPDTFFPGPELHVRPSRGLADPLVLRIKATYPHGTAGFRYDFHCLPMVAGKHDLTQFLETPDVQPAKGLPPLVIEATGLLPAGPPGMLKQPPASAPPKAGWYERMIPYGIALWVVVGAAGFWYFRKRQIIEALAASKPAPTLVEQLRPLLEQALIQPLGTPEKAELERLLLAHGRRQLGLAHATDPAVWQALRNNGQTASWLRTLESWLHQPATSPPSPEELRELLARLT